MQFMHTAFVNASQPFSREPGPMDLKGSDTIHHEQPNSRKRRIRCFSPGPTQGESSSSRAPDPPMLRRRRTSRAGAEDDDPQGEEDLQIIGQELVAVEAQPDAPRRDGLGPRDCRSRWRKASQHTHQKHHGQTGHRNRFD